MQQHAEKRRVLIIDDHPIMRQGLQQCLEQEQDLSVCGQLESGNNAISRIQDTNPDLLIVDISLPDENGISLLKRVRAKYPNLRSLVLSMHDETLYAERALRAGANGYVMKQQPADVLLQAIRKVLDGEVYLSDKMSSMLVNRLVGAERKTGKIGVDRLSDRELEVFQLIGAGVKTRDIAEKLNVSVKTVETHRSRIKEKMNLPSSTELVHYAVNWVKSDS